MNYSEIIARHLLQIKAIKLSAKNPFTWASGIKSPIYCDNRITLSHPFVRNQIKQAFVKAAHEFAHFDVVAGVATAGIPHGALLADALGVPFVYVRSKAKKHGRQNQIEGHLEAGQKVLVIEDLISTGGSSLEAIQTLENTEVEVIGLLAIFTYEMEYSKQKFEQYNLPVQTLTDFSTLIQVAQANQYIDQDDLELLNRWREAPSTWSPAM